MISCECGKCDAFDLFAARINEAIEDNYHLIAPNPADDDIPAYDIEQIAQLHPSAWVLLLEATALDPANPFETTSHIRKPGMTRTHVEGLTGSFLE